MSTRSFSAKGRAAWAQAQQNILDRVKRELTVNCEIGQTGGGCTALFVHGEQKIAGRMESYHWMITDEMEAPGIMSVPLQVGFYCNDNWICFQVKDLTAAIALIKSYSCHDFNN